MSFELKNQVALVTGASRGIGASIAKRLASAGATVVINYKSNEEAAQKVLNEIKSISPKSKLMKFDISKADEVDAAFAEMTQEFEGVQIVVANAGISRDSLLPRSTSEQFLEVLETNLLGTINVVRAASRPMMKGRYGRIICISSVVGESGNKGQSAYAASKSALFGFAKSVALELGSRSITCNVICPGFIETEMTQTLNEEVTKAYFEKIPVGRFGLADEVASAVQFLASKEAAYITGATLDINGGMLMR
jgi:3-oxoacyl-[acyl-carrier protein] reductase